VVGGTVVEVLDVVLLTDVVDDATVVVVEPTRVVDVGVLVSG